MVGAYHEIINQLSEIKQNEPLAKYTTFKIGGPADLFYQAQSRQDLIKAIKLARRFNIPLFLLGGGSKILVSDKGFRGLVIKNESLDIRLVDDEGIEADSGVKNPILVQFATEQGLSGVEFLIDIPGTVGGAILYNARFRDPRSFHEYFIEFDQVKDRCVSDVLEKVKVLKADGSITTILDPSGLVILGGRFRLTKVPPQIIQEAIARFRKWRRSRFSQPPDPVTGTKSTQPKEPSAGCVFRNVPNPWNHPSGRLIDMCGLRGMRVGDALISPHHANFIVNVSRAKAADVYQLIKLCKRKVKEKFGVELKEEICYVGEF